MPDLVRCKCGDADLPKTPAEVRREVRRTIAAEGIRFFFAGMEAEVRMKHETLTALALILPEVLAKVNPKLPTPHTNPHPPE